MRWSANRSTRLLLTAVLLTALLSRLYRLGWHLLWVDEIYSFNVSRMGLGRILENSLYEPHSPLFYLLLKAVTLSGMFPSEAAVRLISALAGTAVIGLLFILAERLTGRPTALVGLLFLLLSPALMFYSQEARAYILGVMAAAASTLFVLDLSDTQNSTLNTWAAWGASSLFGVYAVYSYSFILAVQAGYLLWIYRFKRPLVTSLGAVGLLALPTLFWLAPQLTTRLGDTHLRALGLEWTLQALISADPARYQPFWGTYVLLAVFAAGGLLGLIRLARARSPFGSYLLLQILLPLLGFFVIGTGLLGLHLPNFQSRQFLVLFPAVFLWSLYGLDEANYRLPARPGFFLLAAIALAFVVAGWAGLEQYWQQQKSPEGRTAVLLGDWLEPGDAILSLHHSTSYALGHYQPDWPDTFAFPQQIDGSLYFDHNRFFLGANFDPDPLFDLATVHAYSRIWVLYHRAGSTELLDQVTDKCRSDPQFGVSPFQIILLRDCPP